MTPDEAARRRTELELGLNRFLLIARLIRRGDPNGAAMIADIAVTWLRKLLDADVREPDP